MISKAKSCIGGSALFNYVINENKGYELMRNGLSGTTPKELFTDMQIIQQQNNRCMNNTISIVLSPTINDSKIMTDDQLSELTKEFLNKMGMEVEKNQFIAFVHTEKEHKHIHVLLNRVNPDGTLIPDNFISKKAQRAAHETALKHGWTSAKVLKDEKEEISKNQYKDIKKLIRNAHYTALTNQPKNLNDYINLMAKNDILVDAVLNKQGLIQGYRFFYVPAGVDLKASEVDRNLKLNELFKEPTLKTFEVNQITNNLDDYKVDNNLLSGIIQQLSAHTAEDNPEEQKKTRRIFKR